jgi:hypothetical protein
MELTNESIMTTKSISKSKGVSRGKLWAGAIIGTLLVAFLIFDALTKIIQTDAVVRASAQLGLPATAVPTIGIVLLICTAIYVVPATRMLGAILLTGYLGGAVAMHVRSENGAFPIIFSAAFGVLAWIALVLREPRLFRLLVLRRWPASSPHRDRE